VVLDRLDHDGVLERWSRHLHPAGTADRGVRNVSVPGNLIRRIDNHDPLTKVIRQDTCRLAQHRRLADTRTPK
jgi:hypothetical protein